MNIKMNIKMIFNKQYTNISKIKKSDITNIGENICHGKNICADPGLWPSMPHTTRLLHCRGCYISYISYILYFILYLFIFYIFIIYFIYLIYLWKYLRRSRAVAVDAPHDPTVPLQRPLPVFPKHPNLQQQPKKTYNKKNPKISDKTQLSFSNPEVGQGLRKNRQFNTFYITCFRYFYGIPLLRQISVFTSALSLSVLGSVICA